MNVVINRFLANQLIGLYFGCDSNSLHNFSGRDYNGKLTIRM